MKTVPRLLLVEDDGLHRRDLENFFKKRSYAVTATITFQEAMAALKKETFDVAIIDIEIPESDPFAVNTNDRQRSLGLKLGLHIRQERLTMAVVFRSDYGEHSPEIHRMQELGYRGIGYVAKSMPMKDLESCITRVMLNPMDVVIDPRLNQSLTLAAKAQRYFELAVPKNQQPYVMRALPNMKKLTRMQHLVLSQMAEGSKREAIAAKLSRQPKSIESQVTSIYTVLFEDNPPDKDGIAKDVVAAHVYWVDFYDTELSRGG